MGSRVLRYTGTLVHWYTPDFSERASERREEERRTHTESLWLLEIDEVACVG